RRRTTRRGEALVLPPTASPVPVATQKRDPPVGSAHAGQIETDALLADSAERCVTLLHLSSALGA
ncbi:MAG: hypothetical protein AAFY46_15145, partial [Planctomycetota bacterium]